MQTRNVYREAHSDLTVEHRYRQVRAEASAIAWFEADLVPVFSPLRPGLGVHFVAYYQRRYVSVQVAATARPVTPSRWHPTVWPGLADYLFVVVADRRRWLIPTDVLDPRTPVILGGDAFAEHEIEPGTGTGRYAAHSGGD